MKKGSSIYQQSKKEIGNNKTPRLSIYFTSILKLTIALALFIMAAIFISGAGITAENGALNVSSSLFIDTNTLFVDSANNKVGIGTTTPMQTLAVVGTANITGGNDGVTGLIVGSVGNVGIGTTVPTQKLVVKGGVSSDGLNSIIQIDTNGTNSGILRFSNNTATKYDIVYSSASNIFQVNAPTIDNVLVIAPSGNIGIGTTSPNQKLMVAGNANVTGTVHYGALQANSPILERTAEPFVAKCTIADDGKLVVEYVHFGAGIYSRVIEAVNSNSASWWHRSCFEKNERFKYLDSLNNNSITIEDVGLDWSTKTAFIK